MNAATITPAAGRRAAPTVKILGVDPANKGACLMLRAVQHEIGARFPGARFAMDIAVPIEPRLRYGLWGVLPERWRGRVNVSRIADLAPRRLRRKFGVLTDAEIDVVVDASGFAYGDFWGKRKFDRRIGEPSARWRRDGKAVVFMPQAWGPFTEAGFAAAVAQALNRADIVFARDAASLGHLQAAGVKNARPAPDFTNLLAADPSRVAENRRGLGVLIPNAKMIAAQGEGVTEPYLRFLEAAAAALERCAARTAIMIHEGAGDRRIADALNARLARPMPILDVADELEAKALLASAAAVVSSRFHGLVSALAGGVPALACGWTHKYAALMADYDAAGFSVDLADEPGWRAQIEDFVAGVASGALAERVSAAAAREKRQSAAMWDAVEAALRARRAAPVLAA